LSIQIEKKIGPDAIYLDGAKQEALGLQMFWEMELNSLLPENLIQFK
jgi:hypothetical protein